MPGKKSFSLYVLPIALTSPISIKVGGAPIFILQTIAALTVIIALFTTTIRAQKIKIKRKDKITSLVNIYALIIIISFTINTFFDLTQAKTDEIVSRTISLIFLAILIVLYAAPRLIIKSAPDIGKITASLTIGLAIISFYYLTKYIDTTDLYLARQEINQRIPQILTYLCWALTATFLMKGKTLSPIKIAIFISSSLVVFLSLTRASYIQWAISLISFLIVFKKEISRPVIGLLTASTAFIAITIIPFTEFGDILIDRFSMLLNAKETATTEHSASLRISIWIAILERISSSPLYLLLGTGQLGSSYLNFSVYSVGGDLFGSTSAHSQYLDTYVRSGLPGLIIEISIVLIVIKRSITLKNAGIHPAFFGGSAAALAGILFYGIFHETLRWQMFGALFWFYAGIVSHTYNTFMNQKK